MTDETPSQTPTRPADRPGHFIWHDLSTTEPEEASTFYRDVLGWQARPFEGEGAPPYWTWTVGDGASETGEMDRGGLMELTEEALEEGAPPGWMGYVWTPDTDRDTDRAVELGGAVVVPPMSIPMVGRMSVIRDPQGAVLTLMTPETSEPDTANPESAATPRPPAGPGRFDWHELSTTDVDAAFDFYTRLFGWEETRTFDMGAMGQYRIFGSEGVELGGMFQGPPEEAGRPAWLYYVLIYDLDEALRRVADAGGEVTHGPSEVPGGRIAHCLDPQGAFFGLHEESAPE